MADQASNQWTQIPTELIINKTINEMKKRGFLVHFVQNKQQALEKVKILIPDKPVEVMTGSSTTLYQIGFMDYYLSDKSKWNRLGPQVFVEKDPKKQSVLRRKADTADYFLSSVNAITENGLLIAVDYSGSRVSALPFVADKVILVIGVQKLTKNLDMAMKRIREYVFPLENERAKKAYGTGSGFGKWVIIENELQKDRITIILVNETLGF